ncbi:hypothetical protein DM01DRAFT_1100206 [Hesseltinella vesiculosa]|uniref:Uncharacterized protein n=1 Tax=Hesseltinella vesiculosa TaxID=101127 RepID=A0A1X2GC04_9FUNG|nr:hypothetical protein DM01DRAFT_1100206 [Hesseltinella vesiculosa]
MIGSLAFDILITGSIRIDGRLYAECGPTGNTNNFQLDGARNSCRMFVDDNSWTSACKIAENKMINLDSIHTHSRLIQIRQLKTNFDEIFTCNAFCHSCPLLESAVSFLFFFLYATLFFCSPSFTPKRIR